VAAAVDQELGIGLVQMKILVEDEAVDDIVGYDVAFVVGDIEMGDVVLGNFQELAAEVVVDDIVVVVVVVAGMVEVEAVEIGRHFYLGE
jgi:hypothetical protein